MPSLSLGEDKHLSAAATGIKITTLLAESLPQRIAIAPAVRIKMMLLIVRLGS
jgi:hypothetical protein